MEGRGLVGLAMNTTVNRHSILLMYSDPECISSHRVRLVLAEKEIQAQVQSVDPANPSADLLHLNPQNSLPTLVDRDLVLYSPNVIVQYLDERYPHPPFMPIDPVSRAKTRLALYRIDSDWYSLLPALLSAPSARQKQARKQMVDSLTASADVFAAMPFFLSNEYSILDATLAPLLWRLQSVGVDLADTAAPVIDYARRLFARDGFQASLSEQERAMTG